MDRTGPRSVYNHEKSAFAKPLQTEYLMTPPPEEHNTGGIKVRRGPHHHEYPQHAEPHHGPGLLRFGGIRYASAFAKQKQECCSLSPQLHKLF